MEFLYFLFLSVLQQITLLALLGMIRWTQGHKTWCEDVPWSYQGRPWRSRSKGQRSKKCDFLGILYSFVLLQTRCDGDDDSKANTFWFVITIPALAHILPAKCLPYIRYISVMIFRKNYVETCSVIWPPHQIIATFWTCKISTSPKII